jgi:hypothetical protein
MPAIRLEQRELLIRKSLNMLRELMVTPPERLQRVRSHRSGVKLPESISASIFSRAFSCFPPEEKSFSISSSQASLSRRAMLAANFANSFDDNWSTAFSISARLTQKTLTDEGDARNARGIRTAAKHAMRATLGPRI